MSKFLEYINSETTDKNALSSLKLGTSFGTWFLIFFFLVPTLIAIAKISFGIAQQGSSTVSGIINVFIYYILNPVIATIVVIWQNRKLVKKSLKFQKIYCLFISFILSIFVLVRILGHFIERT